MSDRLAISDYAKSCLQREGWQAGRQWPLDLLMREFSQRGYPLPRRVRDFLSEFGGLRVRLPSPIHRALFDFDAMKAARRIDANDVAACHSRIRAVVCPIGGIGSEAYHLLMDEHGRGFAATVFGDLFSIASNETDLINGLCNLSTKFLPLGAADGAEGGAAQSGEAVAAVPSSGQASSSADMAERVIARLRRLGWLPKRRAPADAIESLRANGVDPTPLMAEFLSQYDGVRRHGFSPYASSLIEFEISSGARQDGRLRLEAILGVRVCSIGFCAFENEVLYLDEKGRFLAESAHSCEIRFLSDSVEEFLGGLVDLGGWWWEPIYPLSEGTSGDRIEPEAENRS